MSDDGERAWEGQIAMGQRLVEEAVAGTPVRTIPLGDRVCLRQVVPDEERPVDITVVRLGRPELPDMAVVVSVGYQVNAEVLNEIRRIDGRKNKGPADRALIQTLESAEFIGIGDVVTVNKFSGMDIPGTQFFVAARQDILSKVMGLPVRLVQPDERWDRVPDEPVEVALPPERRIVTGSR